MEFKG